MVQLASIDGGGGVAVQDSKSLMFIGDFDMQGQDQGLVFGYGVDLWLWSSNGRVWYGRAVWPG